MLLMPGNDNNVIRFSMLVINFCDLCTRASVVFTFIFIEEYELPMKFLYGNCYSSYFNYKSPTVSSGVFTSTQ